MSTKFFHVVHPCVVTLGCEILQNLAARSTGPVEQVVAQPQPDKTWRCLRQIRLRAEERVAFETLGIQTHHEHPTHHGGQGTVHVIQRYVRGDTAAAAWLVYVHLA